MDKVTKLAYRLSIPGSAAKWSVGEFFMYFHSVIENVPFEFRDKASIEIEAEYDSAITVSITYERPKTQEDILNEERGTAVEKRLKLAHYYRLKEELGL